MELKTKIINIDNSYLYEFIKKIVKECLMCKGENLGQDVFTFTVDKLIEFIRKKYLYNSLIELKTAFDIGIENGFSKYTGKLCFCVFASWLTQYKETIQKRNVIEINKSEKEYSINANDVINSSLYAKAVYYRYTNYTNEMKLSEDLDTTVYKIKTGTIKVDLLDKKKKIYQSK